MAGALVAACCALFIYHASAGHIRSSWLRALLAVALVLLPAAPMEIIDSGVNSVWYVFPAMFWALLWRPRTRAGMAVALVLAFTAAASNSLCFLFLPLVAARLYVLRRPREHAVTIGWLAGCLAQVPFVVSAYQSGVSRLSSQPAPPGLSLAFYGHDVVLPAFGWHLVWWLRSLAGLNGATALVGVVLVAIFAVILVTQAGARPFVVTALVIGFIFPVVGITETAHLARATTFPAEQPAAGTRCCRSTCSCRPSSSPWTTPCAAAGPPRQRQSRGRGLDRDRRGRRAACAPRWRSRR